MFDHSGRIARLQQQMEWENVDAVLLSVGADLPYFTGYEAMASERLTLGIINRSGMPALLVPRLESPRVEGDFLNVVPWDEVDDPVALASSLLDDANSLALGDHTWSVFLMKLQSALPGRSWTPASRLTSALREIKSDGEIDLLREAASAVDRALVRIPAEVRFSGRTERSVAADLARMTVEEGHDESAFAIVASGPNGASPHHEPGDRRIRPGDLVVCDFGGRRRGYFSDVTRTFSVGEPSATQLEVHQVVHSANLAARNAVAPGVPCQEIDRAARRVVDEAGYGEFFIHRTGHGIGLEVHEHPYLVQGNERSLEPGMAFSIEPGIYLPGRFGVRIEDIVSCSATGIDELNRADRGLVVVE